MGLAIVLNDGDYSGDGFNIGQVEFIDYNEVAADIASTYCRAIDDNSVYSPTFQLVYTLIQNGLWEKMVAIYPLLGTTAETLKVNLISPGTFDLTWGDKISIADNGYALVSTSTTDTEASGIVLIDKSLSTPFWGFNIGESARYGNTTNMGHTYTTSNTEKYLYVGFCNRVGTSGAYSYGVTAAYCNRSVESQSYEDTPYAMEYDKVYGLLEYINKELEQRRKE